jgi:hypothetical protein
LNRKVTDVRATVGYGREKVHRQYLAIGLLGLFFGLACVLYAELGQLRLAGWVALLLGGALTAYEFYKAANPGKPLLELSPAGIRMQIEMVKDFLIPWREIKGVEMVDLDGGAFPRVTAVLVTRAFYDRVIHVDTALLRGPGWENLFVARDGLMQVAMPHQILPVGAEELHRAVEARWRAFGKADA